MGEEDDDGPWPGEEPWRPGKQESSVPDVDWDPPEPIGVLELPDGTELEIYEERPSFGFARFLDEL